MQKVKKHTLAFETKLIYLLCVAVLLVFAAAAVAGWLFAPFPIGAVLTGVCGFAVLFLALLACGWTKYSTQYYRIACSGEYPAVYFTENAGIVFYAATAETVCGYLRELGRIPPLPERYTREEWLMREQTTDELRRRTLGNCVVASYPPLCLADLVLLQSKTIFLSRKTYGTYRAFFDCSGIKNTNTFIFINGGQE